MAFLEIEAKILEIDPAAVASRLVELGAEKIYDGGLLSLSFTAPNGVRIRVRKFEGGKIFLTYKEKQARKKGDISIQALEYEIEVENSETLEHILISTGFTLLARIPKHRTSYRIGETQFEIDTYPAIPTFLEIEAPSEESLLQSIIELGFTKADIFHGGIRELESHYKVSVNTL